MLTVKEENSDTCGDVGKSAPFVCMSLSFGVKKQTMKQAWK